MDFRPYFALSVLTACCATADFTKAESPSLFSATTDVDQVFAPDVTAIQLVGFECATDDGCGGTSGCGEGSSSRAGCCDDLLTRTSLTNGLWGGGMKMAEHGVVADLQLTQFYQGVSSGGARQEFLYGGKADYNLTFVGAKLGLNEGFNVIMHAETRFSGDINAAAGALALPNANMLYPAPGQDVTAITGLMMMQAISEEWALTAGKYNSLDLFHMLYPNTGRGIEGFMNAAMILPLGLLRTTPLSFNGAGVLGMDGQQINSALLVYDTNNSSTTAGLTNLFDKGAVILGYYRIPTKSGSHGFVANWSSRKYVSTDRLSWTVIPGEGAMGGREVGSWSAVYFLDHMLWTDRCNSARNVRLFSAWSVADGDTSPIGWTGNVSLQGTGLVGSRKSDTAGIGYFAPGLATTLKTL